MNQCFELIARESQPWWSCFHLSAVTLVIRFLGYRKFLALNPWKLSIVHRVFSCRSKKEHNSRPKILQTQNKMFCANLNENLAYLGTSDAMLAWKKFGEGRDRWLERFSCLQLAVVSSTFGILDKAHLHYYQLYTKELSLWYTDIKRSIRSTIQ